MDTFRPLDELHCRNGFLNDQGNALMDRRIRPAATTEFQY
jgi:hypothetical protein